ncbi:hypothetical protein COEREDRAFT_5813 [Coemansia reversa NRRL 1564]|uniref:Conserved oligomeric Golgi complex subunit 8 n=1 Tax=Coemansia reversa (strain ATCC 12441 / NRRL 1564) TaxID=763665 RepID=A0A2G5BJX2_COERN|nr:hypothetical protein COEREDRAFT_5813 [Coemansia reversa NRRL 1564]|eukprot:PIA19299.1 hypothetical protein COEREDRAFT_5813 [Coemansia reversa NRRL 1564]
MESLASRTESESLYGSSLYHEGRFADDADLSEYVQLCRRLFPEVLEGSDALGMEPETEEGIARYLKYLSGLPLSSLRMEPALLQTDLQRVSKDLSMLLLSENAKAETTDDDTEGLQGGRHSSLSMFEVMGKTRKAATTAANNISASLAQTQTALERLEAACERFATETAELDRRGQVVQHVLDKQDVIARVVELPRVMQMCVAGGYYEEAVDIAEHVRVTGDRLVRDIRDAAHVLPGSANTSGSLAVGAGRENLVAFVATVQRQVQTEFEAMVVELCAELSRVHVPRSTGGLQDSSVGVHERTVRRLSQVARTTGVLRRTGLFSEAELRMLFLRSRWQAWQQTVETFSGLAPPHNTADTDDGAMLIASTLTSGGGGLQGSAEAAAFLMQYADTFFAWISEAEQQYQSLFVRASESLEDSDSPFADLALFAARQFLGVTLPLTGQLDEAAGIAGLLSLVSTHRRLLSGVAGYALPALTETLHERAFASITCGVEDAVVDVCVALVAIGTGEEQWERLAASTRPELDFPALDGAAEGPAAFLELWRMSPVGLLQYPILAELLHAFRDGLHALRILVLAADSEDRDALLLLTMTAIVYEAELVRVTDALAEVCHNAPESAQDSARDACAAYVFGVVRCVAEIFEEIETLCEPTPADSAFTEDTPSLYTEALYAPLLFILAPDSHAHSAIDV